jgi:glucose-1-phosphate thymidylyltransferase
MAMKGIILAGGTGSRLYPLTGIVCKQLLPVFDKPMIYYPLYTLMEAGIRDICVISTPKDIPILESVLKDGSQWGLRFHFIVQEKPAGIAQAFLLAKHFIGADPVTLILGDNIFYGQLGHVDVIEKHRQGAVIFGYPVNNPEDFGVIEFDTNFKALSIEEKPKRPKSKYAVPGLYVYDNQVVDIAEKLAPSARGELEITDVNLRYLENGQLTVIPIGRGVAWLDTGTTAAMQEASVFIEIVEKRQGVKISCPEEIALLKGFISLQNFKALIEKMPNFQYRDYLDKIGGEFKAR